MSAFDAISTAKAIHATLDEAFATVPAGRTHVVLIDGTWDKTSGGEASIIYAQRVGDGWDIALSGTVDKPNGLGARVATMKSW